MGAADIRRAKKLQDVVEKFALSLPQAWTDTPWDESHVSKVRKKIFAFHGSAEEPGLSVKLTASLDHALTLRGAARMGYGLGKHGWIYIPFDGMSTENADLLIDFVEESYRSVAPKMLIKEMDRELED